MENNYRNKLSPFGRDVLDVIIRQWRRDRDAILIKRRLHQNSEKVASFPFLRDNARNRRILTFDNTEQPPNLLSNPTLINRNDQTGLYKAYDDPNEGDHIDVPFDFEPPAAPVHVAPAPSAQRHVPPAAPVHVAPAPSAQRPVPPAAPARPPTCQRPHYSREDLITNYSSQQHNRNVATTSLHNGDSEREPAEVLRKLTTLVENNTKVNENEEPYSKMEVYNQVNNNEVTRCDELNNKIDIYTTTQYEVTSKAMEIDWNNMFDTEILSQAALLKDVTFENIQTKEVQVKRRKYFGEEEMFVDSTNKFSDSNSNEIHIISNEIIKPETFKKKTSNKRKAQTKITDTVSKKVKKIPSTNKKLIEPSFRKQNYKKTVNHWLEAVELSHPVAENIASADVLVEKVENNERKVSDSKCKLNKIAKSPKGINTKKVIQAQLVNKDGVMKFKNPNPKLKKGDNKLTHDTTERSKSESNDTKSTSDKNQDTAAKDHKSAIETTATDENKDNKLIDDTTEWSKSDSNDTKSTATDKNKDTTAKKKKSASKTTAADENKELTNKDKKPRSKFIAPLKPNSQIPIKDITYDIALVDQYNFKEQLNNILKEQDASDIVLVLLYRNGFNQLNRHHTEDSCVPEGLMLSVGEKFYYIKDNDFPDSTGIREMFLEIMTAKNVVCYDGKSILIYLATEFKLELVEREFKIEDTQIGGSLLEPGEPPPHFAALQRLAGHAARVGEQPACPRARAAWLLGQLRATAERLRAALAEQALGRVFWDIEMRILPIIADMERRGVSVDLERLRAMEARLLERLRGAERSCHRAAGRTFQINSAPQVRAILYEELQLDAALCRAVPGTAAVPETAATGAKSTSETVLRRLAAGRVHRLPGLVLRYRRLHKAHATFLAGVAQRAARGVVRPVWVQTAAATGRVACSGPNLQAIPKAPFGLGPGPDSDSGPGPDFGPGLDHPEEEHEWLNLRSVYVAGAGRTLLAADFRHVECRVFAHVAGDARLLRALAAPGDLFRVLAQQWLNKPLEQVTGAERERTKRVVYASLYGAGAARLAGILAGGDDAGAGAKDTADVIASFHRAFPALRSFGRAAAARCRAAGGRLAAPSGRARRLPDIAGHDPRRRARAERQALNFLIQGSAADLCKLALADASAALAAARPPLPARLALMVHDELLWDLPAPQLPRAAGIIRAAMEGCGRRLGVTVPLPVRLAHGRSWGELRPLL